MPNFEPYFSYLGLTPVNQCSTVPVKSVAASSDEAIIEWLAV